MKKLCKQSITSYFRIIFQLKCFVQIRKIFYYDFFFIKKKYVVIVETMDNKISLYRGLPGNREFSGIQGLPYFIFNPLRNLLFTKEDIDHSASANDMKTEPGLGMVVPAPVDAPGAGAGDARGPGIAGEPGPGPGDTGYSSTLIK